MPSKKMSGEALELTSAAHAMSQSANHLSERLGEIEEFLFNLSGKLEIQVFDLPSEFGIAFARNGQSWALFCGPLESDPETFWVKRESLVSETTLVNKIRAAKLLPALTRSMIKEIRDRASELQEAHQALDEVDQILVEREGA